MNTDSSVCCLQNWFTFCKESDSDRHCWHVNVLQSMTKVETTLLCSRASSDSVCSTMYTVRYIIWDAKLLQWCPTKNSSSLSLPWKGSKLVRNISLLRLFKCFPCDGDVDDVLFKIVYVQERFLAVLGEQCLMSVCWQAGVLLGSIKVRQDKVRVFGGGIKLALPAIRDVTNFQQSWVLLETTHFWGIRKI